MIVLPDADAIVKLLAKDCPDDQRTAFSGWLAQRLAGRTFDDAAVLDSELCAALDDYAKAGYTIQTVVDLWYVINGVEWLRALAA